jgi:methyl acetate hydrolase
MSWKETNAHLFSLFALNTSYSCSTDWLGQFAVRSSGKSLRQLFIDVIFEPLRLPPSEADIWISPALTETKADLHIRDPHAGFTPVPFPVWATEGPPPEGKAYFAPGCLFASQQAYAKILQAVLNQDPRILSAGVWQTAIKDDLKARGINIPKPEWKSTMLDWSMECVTFPWGNGCRR